MAQAADDKAKDEKYKTLTSMDDLAKYVKAVDDDQNIILCFYDPKHDVASPMIERLQEVMENEGIYTVVLAQIDRSKAKDDILKYYKVDCECIVAIDKSKKEFPAKKKLTNFNQMSIKKLVIAHKY